MTKLDSVLKNKDHFANKSSYSQGYGLQQYMNQEITDVQAGFRKGRGTRDQIANIHWIIEKAWKFQKNIYFCFIDYAQLCVDHNKLWNILKGMGNIRPPYLPPEKSVSRSRSNS